MSLNPYKMKKIDLLKYLTKRCKHKHLYIEHPNCFIKESEYEPRVGFLDIETNGLKANFHIMGSYCIKDSASNKIYGRHITAKELMSNTIDKNLVQDCINDILQFDKIVTYFGTWFDIPFVRTRALKWNLKDFPIYGLVQHCDVYFMVKSKLCLHRRSLDAVTRHLGIEGKTHVDGNIWQTAFLHHDEKALKKIHEHCKLDVIILEKVWRKIKEYTPEAKRSL